MDKECITYEEMCNSIGKNDLSIDFTSKNLVNNPTILKDKFDENYKYINKNFFFKVLSFIFYCFVFIILYPILFIIYVPKIKGKQNLKKVKNAIFIANHTFIMDCAIFNTHILKFKRPYFLCEKNAFQIPVVNIIIKLLNAVPIPTQIKAYQKFSKEINLALNNDKKSLIIYPEGSLWPYYPNIRPFKSGAFKFAVKNNLPIVPIVFSYRKPNKFYRFFGRKKPFINVNILEPIYSDNSNNFKLEENLINLKVNNIMKDCFNENNSYVYINQKRLNKEKQNKTK